MGLSSSFQTAKVVEVMGEQVEFPRLEIYDLSIVSEQIKQRRIKAAEKLFEKTGMEPLDRFNVLAQIELQDPTVNEILGLALTPTGAADLLARSLKKRGVDASAAKDVISSMDSVSVVQTAQELILYKPEKREGEGDPKNAEGVAAVRTASPTLSTSTPSQTPGGVTIPPAYGDNQ